MKRILLSTVALLTFSIAASAEVPSFSYIELGSSKMDFEDLDVDLEGYEIKASLSLSDNYYINYERNAMDARGLDLDIKHIGLGYKTELSPSAVLFFQLDKSYYELDTQFGLFDVDEDGYRASIGLRNMLTDKLEFKAAYQYLDINEEISDIFVVGASYYLSENLSFYADYKREPDYDHLGLGVRFEF